jgi:hypothetical protein
MDLPSIRPRLARRHAAELERLRDPGRLAAAGRVRVLRALDELAAISRGFAADGIDWVLVKGPGLALAAWPDPFVRPFSDLDVFVAPARFGAAVGVLLGLGYRTEAVPDDSAVHWTFTRPGAFAVELHHTFSREFPAPGELVERFVAGGGPVPAVGPDLRVPTPAAHLAYVLLHAYNHGWAMSPAWALDVHFQLVRDPGLAGPALGFFPAAWPVDLSLRVAARVVPAISPALKVLPPPSASRRVLLAAILACLDRGGPSTAASATCRTLASPAPVVTLASMFERYRSSP